MPSVRGLMISHVRVIVYSIMTVPFSRTGIVGSNFMWVILSVHGFLKIELNLVECKSINS